MDSLETELDVQRKKLIKQLEQGEKIENLTASPEWEFFEGWIKSLIKAVQRDMESEAFINDHNGYLKAVAQVQAYRSILNGIDKFKNVYKVAGRTLNQLEDSENE